MKKLVLAVFLLAGMAAFAFTQGNSTVTADAACAIATAVN